MSTHQNVFSIPGMLYDFKVMFAYEGETYGIEKWKVPVIGRVAPIGRSFLGDQCPPLEGT